MKKPQITSFELIMLGVGSALVFPFTFMPVLTAPPANQDAWIASILSIFYIFVLSAPFLLLINQCRGLSANQISETIFGSTLGKIMILPIGLFCIYYFTVFMAITSRFLNIYLFPSTPTWALHAFLTIPACYVAFKGAGVIGRLASFIVPFAIFSIVAFFLMGMDKMDLNEIQPIVADSSFIQLNVGAFLTGARYSEILIFFVFSFYLMPKYNFNKTYVMSIVTFGVCFFLMVLPVLLVLGSGFAKITFNPYYTFTRQIEAFGFLERVQSLNMFAWVPMTMLRLSVYLYMACEIFGGIFKTKSHKGFIIPFAFIGFIIALLPIMNIYTNLKAIRSDQVTPLTVLPIIFIIPMIFVFVYLIRRRKIKPTVQKMQVSGQSSNT